MMDVTKGWVFPKQNELWRFNLLHFVMHGGYQYWILLLPMKEALMQFSMIENYLKGKHFIYIFWAVFCNDLKFDSQVQVYVFRVYVGGRKL